MYVKIYCLNTGGPSSEYALQYCYAIYVQIFILDGKLTLILNSYE